MEKYLQHLLADIAFATKNVTLPFCESELSLHDWIPDEEEEKTAPLRNLEEWTGISQDMLPPASMLSDIQLHLVIEALKKMLDAYNWSFVLLQAEVPEYIQYAAIRDNFNQEAKIKRWHPGFFQLCRPETEYRKCVLAEYCQCAFLAELFPPSDNEDLTPEEERAMQLEIEIRHIQRKYGDDWMKYYPYHLDPTYDDENGDSYDYGFENEDEDNDW